MKKSASESAQPYSAHPSHVIGQWDLTSGSSHRHEDVKSDTKLQNTEDVPPLPGNAMANPESVQVTVGDREGDVVGDTDGDTVGDGVGAEVGPKNVSHDALSGSKQ